MIQIAHIETPFKEKFGVPRQAGLVDYEARVVFEPEYSIPEAVRGLEEFDYIWLIWQFHLNDRKDEKTKSLKDEETEGVEGKRWSPTVRPPRLGGNKRVGVFASRSPFRPNQIGLSSVRLLRIENDPHRGPVLVVSGADLVDGTPILDIKPYVTYADSHPDARSGFAPEAPQYLEVEMTAEAAASLPEELRRPVADAIACDPRPHYQHDPERIYKMLYDRYEVAFRVEDNIAIVVGVKCCGNHK